MNHPAGERTDATILIGVDWTRVREELKVCRLAAQMTQVGLARKMSEVAVARKATKTTKTNKSTINRIENVYGEPDHVPDLDTIERWVLATGGKLSAFFERVEAPEAGAERAHKGTTANTPAPGGRDDKDRTVSVAADRRALDFRELFLKIADVFTDAAGGTDTERPRSASGARAHKASHR